jgi:nucleotide-binding universal stress UspA family protein
MIRTIVVATDFSEPAERATRQALELAQRLDARVHLLHAYSVPSFGPPGLPEPYRTALAEQLEAEALAGLDGALARHKTAGVSLAGLIKRADPREAIIDAVAELKADLVVMGTHGRRGLARLMMGSVAEQIVRSAPCPVLTVR